MASVGVRRWVACAVPIAEVATPPPPPALRPFTLASFNLLADGLAQHGHFALPPARLTWEARWPLLLAELRAVDPDIAFIAEANRVETLARAFAGHALLWTGKPESAALASGFPPDGCGLLVRRERFDVARVRMVHYSELGRPLSTSNQTGIIAVLRDKAAEREAHCTRLLIVAGTHLKAKGGATCDAIRLHQARELLAAVEEARAAVAAAGVRVRVPVVFCGDWNCEPGSAAQAAIFAARGLHPRSVYPLPRIGAPPSGAAGTFTTWKFRTAEVGTAAAAAGGGGGGGAPMEKCAWIDYIMVSTMPAPATGPTPAPVPVGGVAVAAGAAGGDSGEDADEGPAEPLELGEAPHEPAAAGAGGAAAAPPPARRYLTQLAAEALWSLPSKEEIGSSGLPSAEYGSDHLCLAARLSWRR